MATHLMLRLGRRPLQPHRLTVLVDELNSLVHSISSQIFLCEQIASRGAHEHYDVIKVNLGTTCDHCLENGKTRNLQDDETEPAVLIPSPAWAIQVEQLSSLTISIAHRVSQTSSSPRCNVKSSLRAFAALTKVLSRQRRHMEQMSVRRPTEIEVAEDLSAVCRDCGRP